MLKRRFKNNRRLLRKPGILDIGGKKYVVIPLEEYCKYEIQLKNEKQTT